MTVPEPADEAMKLSAHHLWAASVSVDTHTTALYITDGQQAVEISHETGTLGLAADRLAEVGRAMLAHADAIRGGPQTSKGRRR